MSPTSSTSTVIQLRPLAPHSPTSPPIPQQSPPSPRTSQHRTAPPQHPTAQVTPPPPRPALGSLSILQSFGFSKPWQNISAFLAIATIPGMLYYTVKTYNLAAWTAHKDYCEFQRNYMPGVNANQSECIVPHPPMQLRQWNTTSNGVEALDPICEWLMQLLITSFLAVPVVAFLLFKWAMNEKPARARSQHGDGVSHLHGTYVRYPCGWGEWRLSLGSSRYDEIEIFGVSDYIEVGYPYT